MESIIDKMLAKNKFLTVRGYSGKKWTAVKNSSWSERHKQVFGERAGYVICYEKAGELTALCSVIGQPFVTQEEIDANAKLIASAPEMAALISQIAQLDEQEHADIQEIILAARKLVTT
jgi:hypothetical protein